MSAPRHEAVLAAAMLGVVKSAGWMEMPVEFDLSRAYARLQEDGGVRVERQQAVVFARELMDTASEMEGWEMPDFSDEDEVAVAAMLGTAYDQVAAGVRP